MTNNQRMKSDMATIDRREMTDKVIKDSRTRNDEITKERRFKKDEALEDNRVRNDEATHMRREIKDGYPSIVLTVVLLILVFLTVGIFVMFN